MNLPLLSLTTRPHERNGDKAALGLSFGAGPGCLEAD